MVELGWNLNCWVLNYYGVKLEHHINAAMGEGNYFTPLVSTSVGFGSSSWQGGKRCKGIIISIDQELG